MYPETVLKCTLRSIDEVRLSMCCIPILAVTCRREDVQRSWDEGVLASVEYDASDAPVSLRLSGVHICVM